MTERTNEMKKEQRRCEKMCCKLRKRKVYNQIVLWFGVQTAEPPTIQQIERETMACGCSAAQQPSIWFSFDEYFLAEIVFLHLPYTTLTATSIQLARKYPPLKLRSQEK